MRALRRTRERDGARGRIVRDAAVTDVARLPEPVRRYLSRAIPEGRGAIREARLESTGGFFVEGMGWRPFRADQVFTVDPPGFVWDASIQMAPGLPILVRDALVGDHALMRGALWGALPIVNATSTPELFAGSLHRYLAEAFWLPSALMSADWTPIDDSAARVAITRGECRVWLDVHFGPDGMPSRLDTPARARDVDGVSVPTPWQVRFLRDETRDGYRIPVAAEVSWMRPGGSQPYWRGVIGRATYVHDRVS
jgi:hypothetical protein